MKTCLLLKNEGQLHGKIILINHLIKIEYTKFQYHLYKNKFYRISNIF